MSQPQESAPTLTVGFGGLGSMGSSMAKRVATRFEVVGYDPTPPAIPVEGLRLVENMTAVAEQADLIVLSLPKPEICAEGLREIVAAPARRVKVVVETSTIGPSNARAHAHLLEPSGVGYVDSPVSGLKAKAEEGTLSAMVAGDERHISAARPVIDTFASTVFVLGADAGMGQAMKLANNIVGLAAFTVTSEAVVYGMSQGLNPTAIVEVLNASTGRTMASEYAFPYAVLPGTFVSGSTAAVSAKDIDLFVREAALAGTEREVASAVGEIWRSFSQADPGIDFTHIFSYIQATQTL